MHTARLTFGVWLMAIGGAAPAAHGAGAAQPAAPAAQQTPSPPRPTPSTRDPNTPGFVPAKELPDGPAAKKYHYQFVFADNSGNCDRATKQQTLPAALEWLWKGYPADSGKRTQ